MSFAGDLLHEEKKCRMCTSGVVEGLLHVDAVLVENVSEIIQCERVARRDDWLLARCAVRRWIGRGSVARRCGRACDSGTVARLLSQLVQLEAIVDDICEELRATLVGWARLALPDMNFCTDAEMSFTTRSSAVCTPDCLR